MKKLKLGISFFSILITPLIAHAQIQTQYDLDMQAQAKYETADKQLNKLYKGLLKSLSDTPSMVRELKASERAWIAFRDAEATYECSESEGGSIYPMLYSEALYNLTMQRIKQLKSNNLD